MVPALTVDSRDLAAMGIEWFPWLEAPSKAPQEPGVYLMRSAKHTPDIVYIGKAASAGGLRERLFQYHYPGPTQLTNREILDHTREEGCVEVGWFPVDDPRYWEAELISVFLRIHGRLPLWNKHRPRRPKVVYEYTHPPSPPQGHIDELIAGLLGSLLESGVDKLSGWWRKRRT